MGKNSITLDLARYSLALTSLTNEQLGLLMRYIIRYWQGENVEMTGYLKSFFEVIKLDIDKEKEERNGDKYEEMLMKNRRRNKVYYQRKKANSASGTSDSASDSAIQTSETSDSDIQTSDSAIQTSDSAIQTSEKPKNNEKEKVTQKEKEERTLFNEKEIYREKGGQTTLYPPKETKKQFQKPTVEQVHAYAQTLGYLDFDAQHFWDFYECKGWVVGKSPMSDWKRAVVNWQRNEIQRRKEREQRQRQRPTGNSMAERAYRMVHFELENNPEGWIEEERKYNEYKKQHGL